MSRLLSFMSISYSPIRQGVWTALLTLLCLTPLAKASESTEAQFQRVAQRLLAAPPLGADYHRIQLYPINEYTPEVHRRLQVAANLCAAFQTNHVAAGEPIFPLVFRPLFKAESGAVYLTGFQAVTNAVFADNPWVNLDNPSDRSVLINETVAVNANIYGQPVILSANTYWPNFNEFEVKHDLLYYRKLELIKANPQSYPIITNIMIGVGLSNRVAVEFWNPRTNTINRPLRLEVLNFDQLTLRNEKGEWLMERNHTNSYVTNVTDWHSNQFEIPLRINRILLTNAQYRYSRQSLIETSSNSTTFERISGSRPTPEFQITATNTLIAKLIDTESGRLVDFVNLQGLKSDSKILSPPTNSTLTQLPTVIGQMWTTNLVVSSQISQGIVNQIQANLGYFHLSQQDWDYYSYETTDRDKSIDLFRVFCGLSPFNGYTEDDLRREIGNRTSMVTSFNPTIKFVQTSSFQANDPLVHHQPWQLREITNRIVGSRLAHFTNTSIGLLNECYSPWLGNPMSSRPPMQGVSPHDPSLQDPLIYSANNWNFPRLQTDSLKGLGQIHRGTPWQSLYLKPIGTNSSLRDWERWSNAADMHPSNDFHLITAILPEFTGLTNETRMALNESNPELWRSVFTGITVLTNTVPSMILSKYTPLNFEEVTLISDMPQVESLLAKISEKRTASPNGWLAGYGDLLNVAELSLRSPFLRTSGDYAQFTITDEAYERLTEALLERVRPDHADLNLVIENGQARLHLREFFAAGYTVQWSSNLVDWINLTNDLPSDAVIDLEGDTAEATQKFYRVVR